MDIGRYKVCNGCGKRRYISNLTKILCSDCVYKLSHDNMSRKEVMQQKGSQIHRTKTTGERRLFLKIWEEKPHYCENCKTFLGSEPKVHFFSHIKPKSTHPELRLEKSNIQVLCFECHHARDFRGIEEFNRLTK